MSVGSQKSIKKVTRALPSTFDQRVAHYRQLLEEQAVQFAPARESVAAYVAEAQKPLQVKHRLLTPFVPFRVRYSALKTITFGQVVTLLLLVLSLGASIYYIGIGFAIGILALVMVFYLVDMLFSSFLALRGLRASTGEQIDDELVHALKEAMWPSYTILCPLYREAAVVPQLVQAMQRLDYPVEQLQVLILTQDDDVETLKALQRERLPSHFQIVMLPEGEPRTKPRACNYGLLHATGEYVVIYDAEDVPEALQLKKAVLTFLNYSTKVACVQAKLSVYNSYQNFMTRWFTTDFSLWFDMALPGLQSIALPIPLGGTSNHFRLSVLHEVGGWDAFNVTEDCDLGLRLAHYGYKAVILDSTTYEEANSHTLNWLRQRSRWIKGYMQTYLVNMRSPWRYLRPRLWPQFLALQFVIGAKSLVLLVNPLVWTMFWIYVFFRPSVEQLYHTLIPTPVLYIGTLSLIFGNFLYMYSNMLSCLRLHRYSFIKWAFISPLYWLMMSVAAYVALFELIFRPHYWSKTKHGLHLQQQSEEDAGDERSALVEERTQPLAPRTLALDNEKADVNTPTAPLPTLKQGHPLASQALALNNKEVDGNTPTVSLRGLKEEVDGNTPTAPLHPLKEEVDGNTPTAPLHPLKGKMGGNIPTVPLSLLKRESFLDILSKAKTLPLQRPPANSPALPEYIALVFKYVNDETTLRKQLNAERVRMPSLLQDNVLWLLVLVSSVAGLLAVYYFFSQHQILSYLDSHSHLLIARRIVDNATPGLAQLGAVWLPLPHLLMVPFTLNDYLWHSGLAGACISFPCYLLSCVYIYLAARRVTESRAVSFISALLFVLNPNILYLQATPLTEMLLIALTTMACYHFLAWAQDDTPLHLILAAFGAFLATLTRYDGWFLFVCMLGGLVLVCLLRRQSWARLEGKVLVFGTLGGLGILLWLLWNAVIFGDPLYFQRGNYSSQTDQAFFIQQKRLLTYHDLWQSIATFAEVSMRNVGLWASILALCGLVALLLRRRLQARHIGVLMFIVPFVFYVVSLYLGQATIFVDQTIFNVRYGAESIAPAAFFVALLAGYLCKNLSSSQYRNRLLSLVLLPIRGVSKLWNVIPLMTRRVVVCGALLVTIVGQSVMIGMNGAITVEAGIYGGDCNPPSTIALFMAQHYNGGRILLDFYSSRHAGINFINVPYKNLIYEGSGALWQQALRQPASIVDWVIANPQDLDDLVTKHLDVTAPVFLTQYIALAQEINGTILFHHKENQVLPTNSFASSSLSTNQYCYPGDLRHRRALAGSRAGFQMGVVYPREGGDSYGLDDTGWRNGLPAIRRQTGAQWLDITFAFSQTSMVATNVRSDLLTPTLTAFSSGIQAAHAQGYRVFAVPLLFVDPLNTLDGVDHWSGNIHFEAEEAMQRWFDNYWQALEPYVEVAEREGVEQLSIGSEYEWLASHAPAKLWQTLVDRVASHYTGLITYNMNWTSVAEEPPSWLRYPRLDEIGVSAYFPLLEEPRRLTADELYTLWGEKALRPLDTLAEKIQKPLLLSELGFNNRYDTGYAAWDPAVQGTPDPEEQALACDAAMQHIINDPHIVGVFFWGWDDVGAYRLRDMPAAATIHMWFTRM
jgi:cellulose synthase/poly-beta-1,6-N-acetylglucosamine synthase-like glycosyltransferase